MTSDKRFYKLLNIIMEDPTKILTTELLNKCNYTLTDINKLIEDRILKKEEDGSYSFLSVDELLRYIKTLEKNTNKPKTKQKVKMFLKRCYEMSSHHLELAHELFLGCIEENDYIQALEYLEPLAKTENKYYNEDSNFYLFLLNYIADMPYLYNKYANSLSLCDIKVNSDNQRYNNIEEINEIREAVYYHHFHYAIKLFNNLFNTDELATNEIITKNLLLQAVATKTSTEEKILNYVKRNKYQEIIEFLIKQQNQRKLSLKEEAILKIVTEIINITNKCEIPEKTTLEYKKLYDAIGGGNYEIALKLCKKNNKRKGIKKEEDILYILLIKINYLIEQYDPFAMGNQNYDFFTNNDNKSGLFPDIIRHLTNSDTKGAFKCLEEHLEKINKKQYEYLIIELIKLSIIEKDQEFAKPMTMLSNIANDDYIFETSDYIKGFNTMLSQHKIEEARIYLNIILKADSLGYKCNTKELLQNALKSAEKMVNYSRKSEDLNNETNDPDIRFAKSQYYLLLEKKGIIILEHMDDNVARKICKYLSSNYDDVKTFSIGDGSQKRIVLRYSPFFDEEVNIKELIEKGEKYWKRNDLESFIKVYTTLLEFGNPTSYIYSKLGLAYLYTEKKQMAVDFLTIATELSKQKKQKYDYTNLINTIDVPDSDDEKPYFVMSEDTFSNDTQENYGIENIEQIIADIIELGLPVRLACQQLGIPDNKINKILLVCAKRYYCQGDIEKGDHFLSVVESTKGKTKEISGIIREIRENKKFYQNRNQEGVPTLVLKIKP